MLLKYLAGIAISLCLYGLVEQATIADDYDLAVIEKTLDEMAKREISNGTASISIALVADNKIVFKKAWGYSNFWTKAKATPETIYCVGSTFKAVTATAILQLAEQGKLELDKPANEYLGEHRLAGDQGDKVTVRHLLSHTSGLRAGAVMKNIWGRELPEELNELPAKMTFVKEPEEEWVYNNNAYGVAGLIIEKVSGKSYEKYVLENILEPLGVETPGPVVPTPDMLQKIAIPYAPGPDKKPRPAIYMHFDVFPAGDVYLTAEDMARFLGAHVNQGEFNGTRILVSQSIDEAHKPLLNGYALGWGIGDTNGETIITHSGGVPGFLTNMIGNVDKKVGAYVMSNSGNMSKIGRAAVTMLAGHEFKLPPENIAVELPEETLQEYVGEYELGTGKLTISLDDGQLSVRVTGQAPYEVFASAKDKLFLTAVDAQITVERDDSGKVTGLVVHQDGADNPARRLE